ncbi:hypothetical protein BSL78_11411 [Apostichopus japonicus]|uniref:VWFC domain-containing protein n=1 Tax=Stichopus japonicus TaxID=307972 RepID=A0A2G8KUM1_STIJA|nr:hypothetical protein BSL78_11411 [Apostichopus japonicus]
MGDRTVNLHRLLVVTVATCVILLCLSGTVSSQRSNPLDVDSVVGGNGESLLSFSDYSVSASSSDIGDRIPCVFRGDLKLNNDQWTIDSCTLCTCRNGTTDCDIISCGTAKCANPVKIPGECCPLCPYTMELYDLFNQFTAGTRVTEGKINKFKFAADVEIFKGRTSRKIRGENMWRIGAWVSRNSDGSGEKFSYNANVLSEKERAQEFSKAKSDYAPPDKRWNFKKLRYSFDATEGVCADFKYFCIKFNMTDDPEPKFDLDFTYTVYRDEYERQTKCVRLGTCKGVFAETFDWELTGENPIPGQETPVSIDIDVTFRDDTRDLEGDDLWRVSLFGSSNPLEFEYGTIGCIDDVNYICMEFLKGDAPDPEFTLIVEGGRGDVSRDSLVLCKPQECQSRVVFTDLEATLISPDIIVENTDNTDTTVKLKATTDKLLTTTVAGEDLWQVKTFFSTNTNGRGRRVNEQPQILTAVQDDQTLNTGENLAFKEMDFQVDLSSLICDEVPFMCFELAKNPASSIDYTFETQPVQDPFVDCLSMEDVCKGVVFTELEWSREIPEDHVPGTDSPLFIEASVDVEPYSREVTGVDLWQVSVFASRDMLGNERRDPIYSDVLTPIDAATTLPQGGPLTFPTLETPPFAVDKMGCGEFRYLCVEFQKGDSPIPDFTYETISGEDTIVKCRPEDCAGM